MVKQVKHSKWTNNVQNIEWKTSFKLKMREKFWEEKTNSTKNVECEIINIHVNDKSNPYSNAQNQPFLFMFCSIAFNN